MDRILLYFAMLYDGDFDKIYYAIMNKEECDYTKALEFENNLTCKYTTVISNDYPQKLKHLNKPPFVIFYEGNLNLINKSTIGVIGSRENSEYGERICKKIVKDLVDNEYVIISGLAKGIDIISHNGAIENNGKTIAVLGNGINYYYPRNNKNVQENIKTNGLILSEYPPNLAPSKENFPKRNRIIAALSDSILVIEAKKRSGTMITVNEALNIGRDIMCVPSLADGNSGCNHLIKNGAYLVEDINDILEITKR